jgi:hypothetical protein
MTRLESTDLSTSQKLDLAALAILSQGQYGAISSLAESFDLSRPTIYSVRTDVRDVLRKQFEENRTHSNSYCLSVERRQIERTVIALRVVGPYSHRSIVDIFPIIYPGQSIGYGTVQSIVTEAQNRARELNKTCDLKKIRAAALDEMFSQGEPVLAGVDLHSGYVFALCLKISRSGQDWAEVLEDCKKQGLHLEVVVKDAALGIKSGVEQAFANCEQRDDCFHAKYIMGKVYFFLERKAYGAISKEEDARKALERWLSTGYGEPEQLLSALKKAQRRCEKVLELHDQYEQAIKRVNEALNCVDLSTGRLRTAEYVEAEILKAAGSMKSLDNKKCKQVGTYLSRRAPGLASHIKELEAYLECLSSLYPASLVQKACLFLRIVDELENKRIGFHKKQLQMKLFSILDSLIDVLGDETYKLISEVKSVIAYCHRASSAIEGFNSSLRPYLYVQKGVTQGLLELFRFYYNQKKRKSGRFKGRSPYESLTGQTATDWLTLLGYPLSSSLN